MSNFQEGKICQR